MRSKFRMALSAFAVAGAGVAAMPAAAQADAGHGDVWAQQGRALSADTRFFVPPPASGSLQQIISLVRHGDIADARLLGLMEATPQAVWLDGTNKDGSQQSPAQAAMAVRKTMFEAMLERAVPVFVVYDIPGRDCAQYSSGGAPTDAAYQAWVDGVAQGLGNGKAVVLVEPDGLANLPSDCGGAYTGETNPPTDATRTADIAYAAKAFEADPSASVYLDAGNSAWQNVGNIASRLIQADVADTQGFFLNVSNYQYSQNSVIYGTWVSDCIALMNAGSASSACPDQYWNGGPNNSWSGIALSRYGIWSDGNADPALDTAGEDLRYASALQSAGVQPTAHFVVDTSRNGDGPNDMSTYAAAPYDQPSSVISALQTGNWCNPPASGLGQRPTADTSSVSPLLDAYLWVKTPGQSDGQCDAAGGVRAWDYSAYSQPGWPTTSAAQSQFDPLWGMVDPAAGAWFPQQALQLAQNANPPLGPEENLHR